MSRTQWVGTTTTGGLSPLKAQGGNSIESVKGYRGFTRIMSHMNLKEWPSSSLMHTQGKIRHKGKCVRACVCVWAREREKSPVPLSKVAIINGEHRTGYRWLPCTAIPPVWFQLQSIRTLSNQHFTMTALQSLNCCVATHWRVISLHTSEHRHPIIYYINIKI